LNALFNAWRNLNDDVREYWDRKYKKANPIRATIEGAEGDDDQGKKGEIEGLELPSGEICRDRAEIDNYKKWQSLFKWKQTISSKKNECEIVDLDDTSEGGRRLVEKARKQRQQKLADARAAESSPSRAGNKDIAKVVFHFLLVFPSFCFFSTFSRRPKALLMQPRR
jgi:hypothetical protein